MIKWMIASSCLILMMLIIRKIFHGKISARLQYALWIMVALRLLIPVNLGNSVLSIDNFTNQLTMQRQEGQIGGNTEVFENISDTFDPIKVYEGIEEINVSENIGTSLHETSVTPIEKNVFKYDIFDILFVVWLIGAGVVAIIFFVVNRVFGKRLKASRTLLDNQKEKIPVYRSVVVETPCLFGLICPGIYVTEQVEVDENILRHAVVHEVTHYEQGDLVWAVIRCVCLSLHWYNPLVWWAAKLSKQDAELSCDEATIHKLGEDERIAYGKTLIQLTCEKRQDLFVAATTMTSDKKSIKERIQRIAKKSKVSIAALITVVLVSMIVVGCTFTDASNVKGTIENENNLKVTDIAEGDSKEQSEDTLSNAEKIIIKANENTGAGYQDAKLTYVDNAEVGWNYYSDNPWSSETERDALAQAALKELYTLTGYNVTECTYTTDGRSRFIFGKSGDYIRKCIAFYSRDFGFTLCGDSIPYQGYMDARKFHYSDVQQLISPLEDGVEELDGGLSTWYLERSGVYQGEKIIGHEEINQDDTVYVHTKLLFDGGYYVVVIEKRLEIVIEIMGPYYESRHKSELTEQREVTYYKEAQKDRVCLAVMPDGVSKAGGDYRYIVPEDQEKWIKLYNEMYAVSSNDGRWQEDEHSMGIWIVYKDEWTCMTDQGFILDFEKRTEVSDAQEFYELCLNEAKNHGINEPMTPEEMKNFVQATLALEDKMYLLTDEKSLFELQKAFSSSQEIRGGSGCPFTANLCLETKEGEMINISLATDSCNTWLSSGVYYQYYGFEDLEDLRSYFNEHGTDISSALDIFSGNISEAEHKEERISGYDLADTWANAFVNKNIETIVKLATENVIEQLVEYELLDAERTSFGWSSPWPGLFTEENFQIVNCNNRGAEILYYASLSTPHVVVWRETLEFANGQISDWDLQCYENISTIDDYRNAYPLNQMANTPMDYNANGLGQALNKNALLSSTQAYKQLFDARTAALDLLNITRSFELEYYDVEETEDGTTVSIPFLNRNGSIERVTVTMWQPYGKDGIWIPK